jgi:hypothetical protein
MSAENFKIYAFEKMRDAPICEGYEHLVQLLVQHPNPITAQPRSMWRNSDPLHDTARTNGLVFDMTPRRSSLLQAAVENVLRCLAVLASQDRQTPDHRRVNA